MMRRLIRPSSGTTLNENAWLHEPRLHGRHISRWLVPSGVWGMGAHTHNVEGPMLVHVRHSEQLHERVPWSLLVPQMVGLYFLDVFEDFVRYTFDRRWLFRRVTILNVLDHLVRCRR